eukprot:comp9450_c0_seq1/m.4504 comp9450_c0_seq1/g.4504  ORF comp9450_c0_seq1/g.4504 comp9450_c0_seq1/m.4504 type:complete len:367 (-) comp9450_c0_seq1:88-1188(-)
MESASPVAAAAPSPTGAVPPVPSSPSGSMATAPAVPAPGPAPMAAPGSTMGGAGILPSSTMKKVINNATVEEDCDTIYKAVKGIGTNESALIRVICHRDHETLMLVRELYFTKYKRDLARHIADDTSFNFKQILVGLTTPRLEWIAQELKWAVKGLGTAEGAIMDCVAFLTNEQLKQVKAFYHEKYKKTLEEAIGGDTSGNFKQLVLTILRCDRDETDANIAQAEADSEELYKKGEGRWGTDINFFISILTKSSRNHIVEMDKFYLAKHKRSLRQAVNAETSGDFRRGLKALVLTKKDWWVKRFRKAIKGAGTDDDILIRGLVLNNKEELEAINDAYKVAYKKSLVEDIRGDTSGDYRKACLALFD